MTHENQKEFETAVILDLLRRYPESVVLKMMAAADEAYLRYHKMKRKEKVTETVGYTQQLLDTTSY